MKISLPNETAVAVIGASTSGLYAANLLAKRGFDVSVFEHSTSSSSVPRTLIVTSRFRDYLETLGENSVINEISRFEMFSNGSEGIVQLRKPDLIIERSTLIHDLTAQAISNGARVHYGHRFVGMRPIEKGIELTLRTADGEMAERASIVIGADGSQSVVGRAAGWPQQVTVPLVQAIVRLPKDCDRSTSRIWFRPAESPYFYWLIPESDTRGALGLIGQPRSSPRRILDGFLAEQGFEAESYQAAKISAYSGWVNPHRKVGEGDVYLVGDAAGHVKVSTVGGIVTGLRGARAIADLVSDGSRGPLRSLRFELALHLLIRRALHSFSLEDYSSLLEIINERTKLALGSVNRDEMPELVLTLAKSQPGLMLLLVRGITRRKAFQTDVLASR